MTRFPSDPPTPPLQPRPQKLRPKQNLNRNLPPAQNYLKTFQKNIIAQVQKENAEPKRALADKAGDGEGDEGDGDKASEGVAPGATAAL